MNIYHSKSTNVKAKLIKSFGGMKTISCCKKMQFYSVSDGISRTYEEANGNRALIINKNEMKKIQLVGPLSVSICETGHGFSTIVFKLN